MRKKGNRNIVSEERPLFRYARWPALPGGFIAGLIEPRRRRYGLSLGFNHVPFFLYLNRSLTRFLCVDFYFDAMFTKR